jgi:predicted ATP-grasp superfamily ATP-dependent carboligase/protein-tyrosine phosphatase
LDVRKKPSSVLILDGYRPPALAVVRSLAISGFSVDMASPWYRRTINFFSRYIRKRMVYVSHQEDPAKFREFVNDMSHQYDVLLPIAEDTEFEISKFKNFLSKGCLIPIPDTKSLEVANDKKKTLEVASACGVSVPLTLIPKDESTLAQDISRFRFPVIIKLSTEFNAPISPRYRIARSLEELIEAHRFLANYGTPIVQEYVMGAGVGAFCLFNQYSELIAGFTHRRIIEYPIEGGFSTFAESTLDREALKTSSKLLEALEWKAVAMVEFKRKADGTLILMEINPRFWGSISLAIFSGIDFPRMLIETYDKRKNELPTIFQKYRKTYMIRASWLAKSLAQSIQERKFSEPKKLLKAIKNPQLVRFEDINRDIGPLMSQIYYNLYDRVATILAKTKTRLYMRFHLPNFDYVNGQLAVGGLNNIKVLTDSEVKTIVDLRDGNTTLEKEAALAHSIRYLNFPTKDNEAPNERDLKEILEQLTKDISEGRKVLVHCSEGRGRAPTVACAYLIKSGLSFHKAAEAVRSKRSFVNFTNPQLAALEIISSESNNKTR